MTAQPNRVQSVGVIWKVGESFVNKVFPGQEVSEPETSEERARQRSAVHLLQNHLDAHSADASAPGLCILTGSLGVPSR